MQGEDKGLKMLAGKHLISHVIDAIGPQAGRLLISANRNLDIYGRYGYPVISDNYPDNAGPLAGIEACMAVTRTGYLVCIPCDCPALPGDLVSRLYHTLLKNNADVCVVHDGERLQSLFVILKTTLLGSLRDFLDTGQRKPDRWYDGLNTVTADFSDTTGAFLNINSAADLETVDKILSN
jgi:molybdenum cofactor guanylyltransferase